MFTCVLLVLMIQQAVSKTDDCIPTGQTQSDIVDDCDGIKPDKEVKCCLARDQISCVHTWKFCDNVRTCTCSAKEDNDDDCIPTGQSKTGIVNDEDGNAVMKCCSSSATRICTKKDRCTCSVVIPA